jgi:hypothetical protein
MKGTRRRLHRLHCDCNAATAMDQEIAAAFLIEAWEAVTTAALDSAWSLYEGQNE